MTATTPSSSPLPMLSKISQTAWLTAFCHYDCGSDWGLERPVSYWLIKQFGAPSFGDGLSFFTRHGIAARAKWFDNQIAKAIEREAVLGKKIEIWVLGAGFDSRWQWILQDYDDIVSHYREFDLQDLLDVKNEILSASRWREQWSKIERHPGNVMVDAMSLLPVTNLPVIIIAEGLLDYFDRESKLSLFKKLHNCAPCATIFLDAQNSWLLSLNNKRAQRSTGNEDVVFAWAPLDPMDFYATIEGIKITSHQSLLPNLLRYRWPLLRYVPMPRKIRQAYTLIELTYGRKT